jgi:hypothetical protein
VRAFGKQAREPEERGEDRPGRATTNAALQV